MNNEFWMSNLEPDVTKQSLSCLKIPGSHDSFTCDITLFSDIGPDVRDAALKLLNIFGYYAKKILRPWIITQNIDATQQLNKGIRYYDLRVGEKKMGPTDLYITHQLFSGKLEIYLKEIDVFLNYHSKEVVLLDFNHIYLETNESKRLSDMIIEIFGEKIAPYCQYQEVPSLDELWQHKHQVLIFYHDENACDEKFWPANKIPSFWPNTTDVEVMIDCLERALREKEPEKFQVYQGILTPTARTIVFHPFSNLQHQLADNATVGVINWLKSLDKSDRDLINIVIVDFVQDHHFIDHIVQMNSFD